jgi:hypothetical protein
MPRISCHHTAKKNGKLCCADLLTDTELSTNFNMVYNNPSKVEQDQFILSLLTISKPQRRRAKVENTDEQKDRSVQVVYSLLTESHPDKVKVCKSTFLSVLGKFFLFFIY